MKRAKREKGDTCACTYVDHFLSFYGVNAPNEEALASELRVSLRTP